MKSKINLKLIPVLLLMAALMLSGCGNKTVQTEDLSDDTDMELSLEEPSVRMIGEAGTGAYFVLMTNGTGQDIISLGVTSDADGEDSLFSNLLENEDPIAAGETVDLRYVPPTVEDEELTEEEQDEKELSTEYSVRFYTADGAEYELHAFPFEDVSDATILVQDDIAYMEYTSVSTGELVNTLEAEQAIAAPPAVAPKNDTAQQNNDKEKTDAAASDSGNDKSTAKSSSKSGSSSSKPKSNSSSGSSSNSGSSSGSSSSGGSSSDSSGSSGSSGESSGGSSEGSGVVNDNSGSGSSDGGDDRCLDDGLTW